MNEQHVSSRLEQLNLALGQVRAEYEADDELYSRFSSPLYVKSLAGISPAFLVGGRGTGKTTTLRSLAFRGQARISGSSNPADWEMVGAYWKVEPNVVAVFKGKGVEEEQWVSIFTHYLNLKLISLVLDFVAWIEEHRGCVELKERPLRLLERSLGITKCQTASELSMHVDLAMVEIESKINGSISLLASGAFSVLGKPLDYLFESIPELAVDRQKPFMFCLDEYENLSSYQQRLLNTLIKQVGKAPYTFKVGVRNTVGIDRETLIENQPLQDTADFKTVDIVAHLKDESFERFATDVISQRLALIESVEFRKTGLLPGLTLEEEAKLLGAETLRKELLELLHRNDKVTEAERQQAAGLPLLDACMVLRWSEAHREPLEKVLRHALQEPEKWRTRMGNYGYALLFTVREKRVGLRKYYAGWAVYCQLADGNIRYLIRLVYEALRLHLVGGSSFETPVSAADQTRAATRVGETTIQDLQGWSRQGAALTRLSIGLGSYFGGLARERALFTPEISQFRVRYSGQDHTNQEMAALLMEAVGQGVLMTFEENKNARFTGVARDKDYQLHPVLAPYFVYSPRSKRRRTIDAAQLKQLTVPGQTRSTVQALLVREGAVEEPLPSQLSLFEE